jgi:hypothetical protein
MILGASEAVSAESRAKAQVINHLLLTKRIKRGDLIATEFVFGVSGSRADLIVFSDTLVGIEIKSERDSLKRLPSQINSYFEFCGDVIFAVAPKHLAGLGMMGVLAEDTWLLLDDGNVRELGSRQASRGKGNVESVLTRQQLQKLNRDAPCGDKRRSACAVSLISERFVASSSQFWKHVGRRKVRANDIAMLSRFRMERQEQALIAQRQKQQWEDWNVAADRFFEAVG